MTIARGEEALPTVYVETTVVSYLTARPSRDLVVAAHLEVTRIWWEKALPCFRPFVSPVVLEEASAGDPEAARRRLDAIATFPILPIVPGVEDLASRYYEAILLPGRARADSLHLALAAWHGIDYLVSWNCTHIASGRVRRILESVNRELRIRMPEICTPHELMEDEVDA